MFKSAEGRKDCIRPSQRQLASVYRFENRDVMTLRRLPGLPCPRFPGPQLVDFRPDVGPCLRSVCDINVIQTDHM